MGSCLSKKSEINRTAVVALQTKSVDEAPEKTKSKTSAVETEQKKTEDGDGVKKEICVTKHRKSHDKQIQTEQKQNTQSRVETIAIGTPVRTSSCTREEVDAILIQCGRLSRSSSANTPSGKKYSGSKRSYDFDAEGIVSKDEEDELEKRRQSRSTSSPSNPRRRRTPSRERDSSQQRSGSRERTVVGSVGSGRRVSRSPGRRSDTPVGSGVDVTNGVAKPAKLVSVPASLTSSIAAGNEQSTVKRINVKRDVRSPRSQSPAQVRQPPLTLSRSNSRKTDQSPHRRTPLTEIDNNQNHKAVEVQQPKPKLTRTKSVSRSRDFDEPRPNATSYASILLEDIQIFHQKNSNNNVAFTLPQCVTKACSIMDAVADLNSTTSSASMVSNDANKRVEMMKYVTMKRGSSGGDAGDEESSGSNSVAGGSQQRWGSPLEPRSIESTSCLTSKASKIRSFEPTRIQIRS